MTFAARLTTSARLLTATLGLTLTAGLSVITAGTASADTGEGEQVMLKGATTASYYWDDASGRAGDTGLPASGKPMQKGLAASPSWPLMTEGYVLYKGKKAPFFVGDRGPGIPSNRGIMLDLDAKTFADLTGGEFNADTLGVDGNGGKGHIKVTYVITKWGKGVGKKNHPVPFETRAWSKKDRNPAEPVMLATSAKAEPRDENKSGKAETEKATPKTDEIKTKNVAAASETGEAGGISTGFALGGLLIAVGGAYAGRHFLSERLSVKRS
ncbi:hypothetical protein PS9374_07144 [Planomonospora sphaerica]|uniref:Uncharacterized protein n=1 Tax=Planomonospora sphaerica TaxID=161355 RepID=A0A161MFW4_9ACTN|nr:MULTISPECIES: hypothetical protein [Planomonospora]GAT71453.1 hypothetical protein PS9374_07144 [Planomonospora sphaerica]